MSLTFLDTIFYIGGVENLGIFYKSRLHLTKLLGENLPQKDGNHHKLILLTKDPD